MFIASADLSFNDHPLGKIALTLYFSGCSKARSGNFCFRMYETTINVCHNATLWKQDISHKRSLEWVKAVIDSNLPLIDAIVFGGGEPSDQMDDLLQISKFLRENYSSLDIVLYTHKYVVDKRLVPYLDWIKFGPFGGSQYFMNVKNGMRKDIKHE